MLGDIIYEKYILRIMESKLHVYMPIYINIKIYVVSMLTSFHLNSRKAGNLFYMNK